MPASNLFAARPPEHPRSSRNPGVLLTAAIGLVAFLTAPAQEGRAEDGKKTAPPIRIALVESLFRDSPNGLAKPIVEAFGSFVRAQTGLDTEVVAGNQPVLLGRRIADDEVQLGIFQGVEFAWARQKYPELKPLIVIINTHPLRRAALVVRADSKAKGFIDLKGKALCLPRDGRLHCDLFLKHGCGGANPKEFCSAITNPASIEDALDDLVDGIHEAVVLDTVPLEGYRRRKPARCARLKVLQESDGFPPSVIAYRPGRIDAGRLKQFQDGLLKSHETVLGRHLLLMWRMTAFQPVPEDLEQRLREILKVYPAPKEETGKK